jgi:hypothetical protein
MGAALWVASALAIFLVARIIPAGRPHNYLIEFGIAVGAAVICGGLATLLDFGGWREADWRAITFVLLGAAVAVGGARAIDLARF